MVTKKLLFAAFLAVFAFSIVGCSGGSSEPSAAPAPTANPDKTGKVAAPEGQAETTKTD